MKKIIFILSLLLIPFTSEAQIEVITPVSESIPSNAISHSIFTQLLKKYVSKNGLVDYSTFKRNKEAIDTLDSYLEDLKKIDGTILEPATERMAYWLNLYNGLVIQEVLKAYPVQTTAQIPRFFDTPRYVIEGFPNRKLSLLDIEQYFRDTFNDPRLHLVRVNGALGAPPLRQEAFEGFKIEKQLEEQTLVFLKDGTKNFYDVRRNVLFASPLFLWFESDFTKYFISSRNFLIGRMGLPINFRLEFAGFDWKLNDTKYR